MLENPFVRVYSRESASPRKKVNGKFVVCENLYMIYNRGVGVMS